MRIIASVSFLLLLLLQLENTGTAAQEARSDPAPDRMVGAAEVYYLKDKNKTRSLVRIYLQGTDSDRKAMKTLLAWMSFSK